MNTLFLLLYCTPHVHAAQNRFSTLPEFRFKNDYKFENATQKLKTTHPSLRCVTLGKKTTTSVCGMQL